MRLEVCSDNDIFFSYSLKCNENEFQEIAAISQLQCGFETFHDLLKRLFSELGTTAPGKYKTFATMDLGGEEGRAILNFYTDAEFSVLSLLQLTMEYVDDEELSANVAYRINAKKQKSKLAEARIKEIMDIVLKVNPALLNEILMGEDTVHQINIHMPQGGPSIGQRPH